MSAFDPDGRRRFLRQACTLGATSTLAGHALTSLAAPATVTLPFANGERDLIAYPQKRPLIRQTSRPPQLETPFAVSNPDLIPPTAAFFVRYHLARMPTALAPAAYRLRVGGMVATPLELSLADLKQQFGAPVELVAVTQCSGNSRGFFEPRVGGGQSGNGAMGNARWLGIPLKRVLDKAGIKAGARQVTFEGLDRPVLQGTPEFIKALDAAHALDGEVMLAYAMNGADLPMLNGYPVRLVVPGYYGTYWVKHLADIQVLDREFDGFWMQKAYRIPDNDCACTPPGKAPDKTRPIGRYNVRSFITSVQAGGILPSARSIELKGIAFDAGAGIKTVEVSIDGGQSWKAAALGQDLGRFSFREWRAPVSFAKKGRAVLMVRATNQKGEGQPATVDWNPAGYRRHVVESTPVTIA